jgi:hypothetical protein
MCSNNSLSINFANATMLYWEPKLVILSLQAHFPEKMLISQRLQIILKQRDEVG